MGEKYILTKEADPYSDNEHINVSKFDAEGNLILKIGTHAEEIYDALCESFELDETEKFVYTCMGPKMDG